MFGILGQAARFAPFVKTRRHAARRAKGNGQRVRLLLEALEERSTPTVVALTASADDTLFEDPTGQLSDGAGQHFYVGDSRQVGIDIRRGLLKFDLSSIPTGSTINSATLTLHMSKTNNGAQSIAVHRALTDWGEGTSDATTGGSGPGEGDGIQATTNDATWLFSFFNSKSWTNAGGDFTAAASASTSVNGTGSYQWSGANLTADVQQWFSSSNTNFGWILTGNEASAPTAKQFDSRENATAANRPTLTIDFSPPVTAPDLTISKSHADTFSRGDLARTYTIKVTNSGQTATSGTVTVTDTLPTGLSPTDADTGVINGWNVSFSGPTIMATRSDALLGGQTYLDLTITVSVAVDAADSITNIATVSGGGETNTSNDSASDPTAIVSPNQAPVNTLPAQFAGTEDTPLALSRISLADSDAGSGAEKLTFTVAAGTLTVSASVAGGVSSSQITGNGTSSVTITAPIQAINSTLGDAAGLVYAPAKDANGDVTLSMMTDDQGNSGSGGAKTDADQATISISAVNDPPSVKLPATASTGADSTLNLTGISIADVDNGGGNYFIVFAAANGSLSLGTSVAGGVDASELSGNGSSLVTAFTTLAKINATLADPSGMLFTPAPGFAGTALLNVLANDLGASGSGGMMSGSATQSISVKRVLDHFAIAVPANAVAGKVFTVTIQARDASDNLIINYAGTANILATDGKGAFPAMVTFSAGIGSFDATFRTAGNQSVLVSDAITGVAAQGSVKVSPGQATKLVYLGQPTATLPNAPFLTPVSVLALDTFDNVATSDDNTLVTMKLVNAPGAVLTSGASAPLVNGVATFPALQIGQAGRGFKVSASSATLPAVVSASFDVAAVARFTLTTTQTTVTAGVAFAVKVQGLDALGRLVTNYGGKVHFTSTDPKAAVATDLPADATLSAGQATFMITLKSAGLRTISVRDLAKTSITGALSKTVVPGAVKSLRITGLASSARVGQKLLILVAALDQFENANTSYRGTVTWSSTDPALAVVPARYAFTAIDAGKHQFALTFKTVGTRSVTVSDGKISGVKTDIQVTS